MASVEARAEVKSVGDGTAREEQRVGGRGRVATAADGQPGSDVQDTATLADNDGLHFHAARAAVGVADDKVSGPADIVGSGTTAIEDNGAFLDRGTSPEEVAREVRVRDRGPGTEVIRTRAIDDDRARADLNQLGGLARATEIAREGEVRRARVDDGRPRDDVRDATDGEVAVEG